MQKIEKWRVLELSIILKKLSELLKTGENYEWANVFAHFYQEAQEIVLLNDFDLDSLKKLIFSIKECFRSGESFKKLMFFENESKVSTGLNQEFLKVKSNLLEILLDLEKRSIEYIS
ncbi:hypothetical protein ACFLRM_01925 [Acidobacteriota bacterium]